jgi:uncharacterized protein
MSDAEQLSQETIDEFVVAAHHDLPRVRTMLGSHPDLLNETATWMETAILAAAHTGGKEMATFLLEQGASLDICTAAMLGQLDEVQAFLENDPTMITETGAHEIPLLFHAAIGGSLDMVRLLVERGADVNVGAGGNTAMHAAAGIGHADMVRYLIEQGADFAALDYEGRTPLDVAEATGHENVAALLREYMNVE